MAEDQEPLFDLGWDEASQVYAAQAAEAELVRSEWLTSFERARFRDPDPCSRDGRPLPAKDREWVEGWVCPSCGDVEWSGFLLALNHGWHPESPGHFPREWAADFTLCHHQAHLAQRQPQPGDPSGRWSWEEGRIIGEVYVSPTPGRYRPSYGPRHPKARKARNVKATP